MNLKITLILDVERGAELIGLLAKALGRGEAGVSDLKIERVGAVERPAVALRAVPPSTVAKLAARGKRRKRGIGVELALIVVARGEPNVNIALKEEYRKHGLAEDGAGATLSKLATRGYLRHGGKSEWALTDKGSEALMKRKDA